MSPLASREERAAGGEYRREGEGSRRCASARVHIDRALPTQRSMDPPGGARTNRLGEVVGAAPEPRGPPLDFQHGSFRAPELPVAASAVTAADWMHAVCGFISQVRPAGASPVSLVVACCLQSAAAAVAPVAAVRKAMWIPKNVSVAHFYIN